MTDNDNHASGLTISEVWSAKNNVDQDNLHNFQH